MKGQAWRWRGGAVLLLLAAMALRLYGLTARPLWFDEAIEYWVATASPGQIVDMLSRLTHDPPLYSFLLHAWRAVGTQEWWLRFPSLLASLLGIAGVLRLGRVTGRSRTAFLAGTLLLLAEADVRFAQETGQYALMIALVSWNMLALQQILYRRRAGWWALWLLTAVGAVYTHYGALIVVAVTGLLGWLALLRRRDRPRLLRLTALGTALLASLVPLYFLLIVPQLARLATESYAVPLNLTAFWTITRNVLLYQLIAGKIAEWSWTASPAWVVLPVLAAGGIALLTRSRRLTAPPLLFLATLLAYYAIGTRGIYFYGGTRHSLLLLPLFVVTLALGIDAVWERRRGAGLALLLLLVAIPLAAPRVEKEDLRAVVAFWAAERGPGDFTYVYYGAVPALRYHLEQRGLSARAVSPDWYSRCFLGEAVPFCRTAEMQYGAWIRGLAPEEKRAAIVAAVPADRHQFWFITAHAPPDEAGALLSAWEASGALVQRFEAPYAAVYLVDRAAASRAP